jgi:hypothetical protein
VRLFLFAANFAKYTNQKINMIRMGRVASWLNFFYQHHQRKSAAEVLSRNRPARLHIIEKSGPNFFRAG